MNDFEQKLARQTFREPPAALRAAIVRACAAAPAAWTWRDWLWPSPQAWAALAALWLLFAAVQFGGRPAAASSTVFAPQPAPDSTTPAALFSMHTAHDFRHVVDLPN